MGAAAFGNVVGPLELERREVLLHLAEEGLFLGRSAQFFGGDVVGGRVGQLGGDVGGLRIRHDVLLPGLSLFLRFFSWNVTTVGAMGGASRRPPPSGSIPAVWHS